MACGVALSTEPYHGSSPGSKNQSFYDSSDGELVLGCLHPRDLSNAWMKKLFDSLVNGSMLIKVLHQSGHKQVPPHPFVDMGIMKWIMGLSLTLNIQHKASDI